MMLIIFTASNSAKSQTQVNSNTAKSQTHVNDADYPILTKRPSAKPRLNNALVYGCRPNRDFLYRIPCQGVKPIKFEASGLPEGLKLDKHTGIIKGKSPQAGTYSVTFTAKNNSGKSTRPFKIISGDKIGLTPPMGWNDWYAHYDRVTGAMMRQAADLIVENGMADVGYSYVNIDDCWAISKPNNKSMKIEDNTRYGIPRDSNGNIQSNINFPDMKGLTDYIHSKGLKAGIYASPGPSTCMNFEGSFKHEEQDARQFAAWGFDWLKYDACSYPHTQPYKTLEDFQKPYIQMGNILKNIDRDIFYNLCQYGRGNSWTWAAAIGGNSWRTAGDLGFKELDRVIDIGLRNASFGEYNKPGEWNDPDYISIGYIGSNIERSKPQKTKMPPWLQYSYMSMWSLMAAPLFYSGDLTLMDEFTLSLLCNPEIIEINQDPLGECGKVIKHSDKEFLMVKKLQDGSIAVGLFNRNKEPLAIEASWDEIGVKGKQKIRDVWRQEHLGVYQDKFEATIPGQGVLVIKLTSK